MSQNPKRAAIQTWEEEEEEEEEEGTKRDAARELRDIFGAPEDEEYEDIVQNADGKLERPVSPALPRITSLPATPCTECGRRLHAESGGRPFAFEQQQC